MTQPKRVPQIRRKPNNGGMPSNRGLLYLIKDYFSILFDLKFSRYLTVQLLPLLYVVLVIGGLGVIAQQVWDAFAINTHRGLMFLLASPVAVLVWASACRATTEFLLVVFRMSQDVQTLASIKPTVDKLDNLFSGPNWISRLMPFIKAYQASRDDDPTKKN
ncbi:MAG: DUF4282 domain-containing protein [Moraxellaceae bacterium]|nr:DUF4282 domain-containing protein [Moraxellaceae bacterium]MDP1775155.1 DUF4282 domain-containing protein [Moraxellaceae bacterium]